MDTGSSREAVTRADPQVYEVNGSRDGGAASDAARRLARGELVVLPTNYACPSAILVDGATGPRIGMSDVMSPWSGAVTGRPQ